MIRARSGKSARRLLLGAGAMALIIPVAAGCEAGNSAPTLEFHPAAAGAQTTVNGIQVSNAFVLGAPSGSTLPSGSSASMFVALYNGNGTADTLVAAAAQNAASVKLAGGSVALPATAAVNLTGPQPKVVLTNLSKPLVGGSTVKVTLQFEHAGQVSITVPVEPQSFYWSTYSAPASSGAGSSATPVSSVPPSAVPTTPQPTNAGASSSASASTGASPTASPSAS